MDFDDVRFDMIGRGGIAGERPLVEHIEEELQRLAQIVHEPDRGGAAATITIKLTIKAEGDTGVVIVPALTVREPARGIRALSAIVTQDGQVLTVAHKQQALPDVLPIARKKTEGN